VIVLITEREQKELKRRERAYRGDRPEPDPRDRNVILVDDGVATGTTMRSAIEALKNLRAASVVIAVPVAPESICKEFRIVAPADELSFGIAPPGRPAPFKSFERHVSAKRTIV
jgi:predicted phosphoribosyltransferase